MPSQIRCEWMRTSSANAIRAHVARRGTSIPSSFSIASTYTSSFAWNDDVVDPRRVRDGLPPGLRLHVLLEAGVQVADDRADARDRLAVEVDDEAQDAVRGRVVGPEVDREDVLE